MIEDKTTQVVGRKIYWLIAIATLLVLLGTVNNIFSYLALVLCAVVILSCSNDETVCLMVFLMSFANIFKPSAGAQSFYTYLWLLYAVVGVFRRRHIPLKFFISIIVFGMFLMVRMEHGGNLFRWIKLLANILFLYCAMDIDCQKYHKKIFMCYILGVVLASVVMWMDIFPNIVDYIGEKELEMAYNYQLRFAGMYADPNCYSVNLIISLCLLVCLYHAREIKVLPALVLTGLILNFAIMTYSKSTILMIFLPIILLLYSQAKKRKFFIFSVLGIATAILVFNAVAGNIPFLSTVISRFTSSTNIAELTTGRSNLWQNYFRFFSEDPLRLLFSAGIDAGVLGRVAHNSYIDVMYYLGVLGGILIFALLNTIIQSYATGKAKNFLNNSVWLAIAFMYFFLSLLFYFDWPVHFLMAMMVRNLSFEKEKMI